MRADLPTRPTLLVRLRDLADVQAWNEFFERYTPIIYDWTRRLGLQPADAADVTQTVFSKVVGAIQRFDYDPARGSFRGWLKTVTRHAADNLRKSWRTYGRGSADPTIHQALESLADEEKLLDIFEAEIWREAEERVKLRVRRNTWQAFYLTAVEQIPAVEVAGRLGMRLAEVYVAKSRVIAQLRREVRKLNGESPDDEEVDSV
jgi:RNA polymerase sigma-70 factor (ECF subfamily)